MASISPPTTRGPQNPGKYPRTGPTYAYYGEQPGFVYNPWTDRYVVDPNAQREYEEQQGIRQKEPKQPSAGNQLATTIGGLAAGTAAVGLTKAGVDRFTTPTDPKVDPKLDPNASGGLIPKGDGAAAAGPTAATQNTAPTPGASGGLIPGQQAGGAAPTAADPGKLPSPNLIDVKPVQAVGPGTMKDGTPGTLMEDGAIIADNGAIQQPNGEITPAESSPIAGYIQAAGGAAQAYNGWKQYQGGEKLGGAANVLGGTYNAAAGANAISGGSAGWAQYGRGVGTAVAAAQVGQQMLNQDGNSADRAANAKTEALKAAMLYIPVYGQAAYLALAGADAVTGGKATQAWASANKSLDRFNNKIDFGLQKKVDSILFHQSTRGKQKEHTAQLLQQSDDPTWQNYVAGMRAQVDEGPKDPTKPFAGEFSNFEDYKKAGLRADDLTGVYGNLDAFKPDYAEKAGVPDYSKLTFDQQKAVTQRLIDKDMYASKNGEVVIPDKEAARREYEALVKTFKIVPPPAPGAAPGTAPPGVAPLQPGQTPGSTAGSVAGTPAPSGGLLPPRTGTSPGFDKNGRRISYGKS